MRKGKEGRKEWKERERDRQREERKTKRKGMGRLPELIILPSEQIYIKRRRILTVLNWGLRNFYF